MPALETSSGNDGDTSNIKPAASLLTNGSTRLQTPPTDLHVCQFGGLGSETKTGIDVAVPLVGPLLLGIETLWFIRRRKQQKITLPLHQEQEKNDGGLPEHVVSLLKLSKYPSYADLAVGPNSVHGLNAHQLDPNGPAEVQGTPFQRSPRHEMDEFAAWRHELTENPMPCGCCEEATFANS